MTKLKITPCQFCLTERAQLNQTIGRNKEYWISCPCGIEQSGLFQTKEDAINHWDKVALSEQEKCNLITARI